MDRVCHQGLQPSCTIRRMDTSSFGFFYGLPPVINKLLYNLCLVNYLGSASISQLDTSLDYLIGRIAVLFEHSNMR